MNSTLKTTRKADRQGGRKDEKLPRGTGLGMEGGEERDRLNIMGGGMGRLAGH